MAGRCKSNNQLANEFSREAAFVAIKSKKGCPPKRAPFGEDGIEKNLVLGGFAVGTGESGFGALRLS